MPAMKNEESVVQFFGPGHMVFRCFSQVRDMTANDNMTPFQMNRVASDIEAWAKSRADEPAFAQVCYSASKEAQRIRRQARVDAHKANMGAAMRRVVEAVS
jgi:hypothetical protein